MIDFVATNPVLVAIVLAAGFIAGFAGGLFGIGGGIVIVPTLYAVFNAFGASDDASLKTAIGTSLGVIIVTSIRALMTHHNAGHVDMQLLRGWAPWIGSGAALGGIAARWTSAEFLTVIFAAGAIYVARRRLAPRKSAKRRNLNLNHHRVKIPVGVGTGFFSSLMGLGGGAAGVLVMTASGRSIHQAVATSAGFGIAVAGPAIAGFIYSGFAANGLPSGSVGYFNGPAFVAMALMAGVAAPLGARLAHRTSAGLLSRAFGVFIIIATGYLVWDVFSA